jgi:hypothetical protein
LLLNLSLSIPLWASEIDKSGTTIEGFNYASATAGILPDTGCELVGVKVSIKRLDLLFSTL